MGEITESELLEELRRALGSVANDSFTTTELAEALGVGDSTVRRWLKPLTKRGRVVPVFKVITSTHGRSQRVPAYRIAA